MGLEACIVLPQFRYFHQKLHSLHIRSIDLSLIFFALSSCFSHSFHLLNDNWLEKQTQTKINFSSGISWCVVFMMFLWYFCYVLWCFCSKIKPNTSTKFSGWIEIWVFLMIILWWYAMILLMWNIPSITLILYDGCIMPRGLLVLNMLW